MKFAVVVSRYNHPITQGLLNGALAAFRAHKIPQASVKVIWVPGAFEIPFAVKKLAGTGNPNAVIALGCVLKGETPHNHYISETVARALMRIALETGIPVSFGVLTPNTLAQARARSGKSSANKGAEAAEAAIEMAELLKSFKG